MRIERLTAMANDIGAFFAAEPDKTEAVRSVASHLRRYWDPRMRRELIDYTRRDGEGLTDLARAGVELLAEMEIKR